jgi:tRNA 2-thiouridine synthesizing protein D
MKFAIVVHGAPYSSEGCLSALRFTEAALAGGHEIVRVFFYHDGVYTATALAAPPQDEIDIVSRWRQLHETHHVELVACVASCLRRGILDPTEAERYEKPASNIAPGFLISGLGQLIDATLNADRVVTFGA